MIKPEIIKFIKSNRLENCFPRILFLKGKEVLGIFSKEKLNDDRKELLKDFKVYEIEKTDSLDVLTIDAGKNFIGTFICNKDDFFCSGVFPKEILDIENHYLTEKIISAINDEELEICSSEEEAINSLIDRYSEDIFEEFIDKVRTEKKYDLSLFEYIKNEYYYSKVTFEKFYFIDYYSEIYDEEMKFLLEVSKANTIEELIEYCEKGPVV